jgi:hypothetical protein
MPCVKKLSASQNFKIDYGNIGYGCPTNLVRFFSEVGIAQSFCLVCVLNRFIKVGSLDGSSTGNGGSFMYQNQEFTDEFNMIVLEITDRKMRA